MIKISRAKPSESQKVREFERKVWGGPYMTGTYDIASFVSFGYVFLAKDQDEIIGAIIAMKTKNDEVYIADWFVHPKYRRTGIGTKLYERLKEDAQGLTIIAYIESKNIASLKGHEKLGFKRYRKTQDPFYIGDDKSWWIMKSK
ncbi:MAG: GNAT family N-acetyltransferase [Candidatus Kerfeldbacteria bacterium]|nr:GNAT family N-acetyltransferase [Candidatus Kerfeldbacteria bacterium]